MSNLPCYVGSVIDIVEHFWSGKGLCPKPHALYESWMYEIICGPTVNEAVYFSLVVTGVE